MTAIVDIKHHEDKAPPLRSVLHLVKQAKTEERPDFLKLIGSTLGDQVAYTRHRVKQGYWEAGDEQALRTIAQSVAVTAVPSKEAAETLGLLQLKKKELVGSFELDPSTPPGTPEQPHAVADADSRMGLAVA